MPKSSRNIWVETVSIIACFADTVAHIFITTTAKRLMKTLFC
jgi:hypothetical protein